MSTQAQYAATPKVGIGALTIGDASRTAPLQPVTVFSAGSSGSRIDRVVVEAAGTTTASVVRLFVYNGSTYSLFQELTLAAATPSGSAAGTTTGLSTALNAGLLPLVLPSGYSLRATVDATQLAQAAQVDSLVASATLNGVVTLGNSKFTVTAASTAAASALATTAGAAFLTLTASPYAPAVPSVITLTSTGNISAVNFTIAGTDSTGAAISEVLAGPNNNTVYSVKSYTSVTSIWASGAVGTNTSAGIGSSVYMPVTPSKITVSSAANQSGINFTIRGIASDGTQLTEVLVGPAAGAVVTSVNTYKAVTYVSTSGSAATTVIGTPAVMTAVNVVAIGGDF